MRTSVLSKFRVERDPSHCTQCQTYIRECAFEANWYDAVLGIVKTRQSNCAECQNCMIYSPANALSVTERGTSTKRKANPVRV